MNYEHTARSDKIKENQRRTLVYFCGEFAHDGNEKESQYCPAQQREGKSVRVKPLIIGQEIYLTVGENDFLIIEEKNDKVIFKDNT